MATKTSAEELHRNKLIRDRDGLQAQLDHAKKNNQPTYVVWLDRAISKLTHEIDTLEKRISVTSRR